MSGFSGDPKERMEIARKFKNTTTNRMRERVVGDGPDRTQLPPFKKLCSIPDEYIYELREFFFTKRDQNDLDAPERYSISEHCPLKFAIPDNFHHVLLTSCSPGQNGRSEQNYKQWTAEAKKLKFYKWFNDHFPNAFRVRLSSLAPNEELSWHIDTNTSVACRCSVALDNDKAVFEIKVKGTVYRVPFQLSEVFFTNTGYPHRVFNPTSTPRLNLVFGIKFDDIRRWFQVNDERFI